MCREWEAECLWGYFGWQCSHIHHLRLGFYTGDIFTPTPTVERDVLPILEPLERDRIPTSSPWPSIPRPAGRTRTTRCCRPSTKPRSGTPRRTGGSDIRIWGYRNVWYRFHPAEANVYVPVSMNMFSVMESAFMNTFVSQREASFPSYEHDGPFCELAQQIQVRAVPDAEDVPRPRVVHRAPQPADPRDPRLRLPPRDEPGGVPHTARDLRQAAEAV